MGLATVQKIRIFFIVAYKSKLIRGLLCVFTGLAIVVGLSVDTLEVRDRLNQVGGNDLVTTEVRQCAVFSSQLIQNSTKPQIVVVVFQDRTAKPIKK